jgi:hypothetical protein
MRGEILRTLAAYGGPTADAVLRVAARDTDADVRVVVCNIWGNRGDAGAEILISVFNSDSDRDVRMAAARGLGHTHGEATKRALGTGLSDPDPGMRYAVMVALHDSTGKDYGTDPGDKEAIAAWKKYTTTGEETAQRPWTQRLFPPYR